MVTELHGGFVLDTTMKVQQPLHFISERAAKDNIAVQYKRAFPGTKAFPAATSSMFGSSGLNVTYWETTDWSGPVNQTSKVANITGTYPANLGSIWPDVFSSRYEGHLYPNETGLYYFSLYGNGNVYLYLNEVLVASLNGSNFGMEVQGVISLTKNQSVTLRLDYSMVDSVDPGAYGVTLGLDIEEDLNHNGMAKVARQSDLSIIFVNDEHTEGLDSNLALRLPSNQDELISKIAENSKRTVVVLNTNSAILMPWLNQVDAVVETFYPGQQIGSAIARLLFGDVNFSGKLPVTFPRVFKDMPTSDIQRFPGLDLKVDYSEGLHVGYRWFDENHLEPLFPFGYGLSYTEFTLSNMRVAVNKMTDNESLVDITVSVHNKGDSYGQEVVQLYVQFPEDCEEPPRLLKGFRKISLSPRQTEFVKLTLSVSDLSIWSAASGEWQLVPGEYVLFVGNSSRDLSLRKRITLT